MNHEIQIVVHDPIKGLDRDVSVIPSQVHAKIGDTVEWTMKNGAFTIQFTNGSPFFRHETSRKPESHLRATLRHFATVGTTYSYAVEGLTSDEVEFKIPHCPEIIIQ